MPLYIKDDVTAGLVAELAERLKTTKQAAVKSAVTSALSALSIEPSFEEKLKAFYARHPRPEPTGEKADKAFFDELSGEFD